VECSAGPYDVGGLTLSLAVDAGATQHVLLTSHDPVTAADLADEVNTKFTGMAASAVGDTLVLASATIGTGSKLTVVTGTSLSALGLTVGDHFGKAAHLPLVTMVYDYTLEDTLGGATHSYVARATNAEGGVGGTYIPVYDEANLAVDPGDLALLTVDLASVNGVAAAGQRVALSLANPAAVTVVSGLMVGNEPPVLLTTDEFGHAETLVVKGITVDVHVSGTSLARRIIVPSADFALGDTVATAEDLFQIHVLALPAAPHHT
jgi:hypothetical protein